MIKLILLIFGILLLGCHAPHDNPFDPLSPVYKPPETPTRIIDLNLDSLSDLHALISWTAPRGSLIYRLYSGSIDWDTRSLVNAQKYSGQLPEVGLEGEMQSVWIDIPPMEARKWALFSVSSEGVLSDASNSIIITPAVQDRPGVCDVWGNSFYQLKWAPPDIVELHVTALIEDPDGVDSVWVELDESQLGNLLLDQTEITWNLQIPESQIPGQSLERIIGYPLYLFYRDRAGFQTKSDAFYVIRLIRIPPEVHQPANDTLVVNMPRLEWYPYYAEYKFTYAVEVIHVSPSYIYTLWYRREGIDSDSTGLDVNITLPTAQQFLLWTVAVVDEFGNRAVSYQSRFRVYNE